eukprot:GILI01023348.1.p1 GENE.GILI01023348.1~~GILI01023348.1.p1  ORF type:complete len:247 (-),score=62.43 GILI01023348.1:42-782(-)
MIEVTPAWLDSTFGPARDLKDVTQAEVKLLEDNPPEEEVIEDTFSAGVDRAKSMASVVSDVVANSQQVGSDKDAVASDKEEAVQKEKQDKSRGAAARNRRRNGNAPAAPPVKAEAVQERVKEKEQQSMSQAQVQAARETRKRKKSFEEAFEDMNPEEQDLFCICKRPYEDGSLMFECEGSCLNWYHPLCLGISQKEATLIAENEEPWMCPTCAAAAASSKGKKGGSGAAAASSSSSNNGNRAKRRR